MPYVNIKESKTAGGIAVIVGKLQSQLSLKVMENAADLSKSMREGGCPDRQSLQRAMNKKDQIDKISQSISKQLLAFRKMSSTIQIPIKGLEAAIKIIKMLPIPQAVPPGFGIPISITTKFADTLHLLKEMVKQAKDISEGIDASLKTPLNQVNNIKTVSDRVNILLQVCNLKLSIEEELARASQVGIPVGTINLSGIGAPSGTGININEGEIDTTLRAVGPSERDLLLAALREAGLYDENNEFILVSPAMSLLDFGEDDNIAIIKTASGEKRVKTNKTEGIPNATFISANGVQSDLLQKLELANSKLINSNLPPNIKSNIRSNLTTSYKSLSQQAQPVNGRTLTSYYTGPNGIPYSLEIMEDSTTQYLAPKRYAVAKDMSGVIVMKGAPSFSSSTDILIEEIKFRIDHQLP